MTINQLNTYLVEKNGIRINIGTNADVQLFISKTLGHLIDDKEVPIILDENIAVVLSDSSKDEEEEETVTFLRKDQAIRFAKELLDMALSLKSSI